MRINTERKRILKITALNTGVLFSGGKDSNLALYYALKSTNVKCLIIIQSENSESYMFHTPNIKWAKMQAKNMGIPAIVQKTKGVKEKELLDLEKAIKFAIRKYKINAVVTGAVESVYQASRVQKIANKLDIECFNPLWQKDQIQLLKELITLKFDVIIVGTFAYVLENFAGRKIDEKFISDMLILRDKYKINPAGEGGELESFVLDAPFYKTKLSIKKSHVVKDAEGGRVLVIDSLEIP